MSRSSSNLSAFPASSGKDDASQKSSSVATPTLSSQAGTSNTPGTPATSLQSQIMTPQQQIPTFIPQQQQQHALYPPHLQPQSQPGVPQPAFHPQMHYRFASNPQQQPQAQHGMIHPADQQQQSHYPAPHHGGYIAQIPFSPQGIMQGQTMFSPQMGGQIAPGQFMQPMYVQTPHQQMQGGPQGHVYYQQMPQPGSVPPQYMAVPHQGLQMPTPQPVYEQSTQ